MGQSADEVRREIERTRADMSGTIEAIGERVSPRRIVQRRTDRMRDAVRGMRETVMGTAEDSVARVGHTASSVGGGVTAGMSSAAGSVADVATGAASTVADAATGAVDSVRHAPEMARRQAQGNPLAAGIVAFGGGLLLASVLPASRAEEQFAPKVIEPLKEQARTVGEELAGEVQSTASEAAQAVTDRMSTAAQQVAEEAASAGERVADEAKSAAGTVQESAQS